MLYSCKLINQSLERNSKQNGPTKQLRTDQNFKVNHAEASSIWFKILEYKSLLKSFICIEKFEFYNNPE